MDKTQETMLRLKIRSLINQLEVLDAQLRQDKQPPKRFTDLQGIWAGADFSYEEINAAEYKMDEAHLFQNHHDNSHGS